MRRFFLQCMGLVLVCVSWPGLERRAEGTRMVPLTIEQLAAAAGLVVHARVESLEAVRDREGRVFTRVGLRVVEVWKGRLPGVEDRVEAVAGGGVLGDRAVRVAGQAAYAVGEEVVGFLVRNDAGEWVTLGLAQGRFGVRTEAGTGRRLVGNVFWGDGEAGGAGLAGGGVRLPTRRELTLDELKRRTQEVAP